MPVQRIAFGLAIVCMLAGIVLIGMQLTGRSGLLPIGLALVVIGLGVSAASRGLGRKP